MCRGKRHVRVYVFVYVFVCVAETVEQDETSQVKKNEPASRIL